MYLQILNLSVRGKNYQPSDLAKKKLSSIYKPYQLETEVYFSKRNNFCLKKRFSGVCLLKRACVRPNSILKVEKSISTFWAKIKTVLLKLEALTVIRPNKGKSFFYICSALFVLRLYKLDSLKRCRLKLNTKCEEIQIFAPILESSKLGEFWRSNFPISKINDTVHHVFCCHAFCCHHALCCHFFGCLKILNCWQITLCVAITHCVVTFSAFWKSNTKRDGLYLPIFLRSL